MGKEQPEPTVSEVMSVIVHIPRKLGLCGGCKSFFLDVADKNLGGDCRHRAPFVNPMPPHETVFPFVRASDTGCGAYQRVVEVK